LQARELSTTWQRNIKVIVEGMMTRIGMIRKGMVGFDRMRENKWGMEEESKHQGENLHDMQDQAE
jgi:hypothetical protein